MFSTVVMAIIQYVTVIKILKVLYCVWECTNNTHTLSLSLSENILLYCSSLMKIDEMMTTKCRKYNEFLTFIFHLSYFFKPRVIESADGEPADRAGILPRPILWEVFGQWRCSSMIL